MGVVLTVVAGFSATVGLAAFYVRRKMSRHWIDLRDDPTDLAGKIIIVTGGTVGLGYEAARDLAIRRRAHVVIGCRDMERGHRAVQSILRDCPDDGSKNALVECLQVDLASLASVRQFAQQLQTKYKNVYALVLNAGVWVPMEQQQKTADGLEIHFGVNHLAHWLIVQQLLSNNNEENGFFSHDSSRIVFVSSSLAKQGKLDLSRQPPDELVKVGRRPASDQEKKSFAPTAYCDSKLMNVLTCRYLANHYSKNSTSSSTTPTTTYYSVCPGFCRSSLGRHVPMPFYKKALLLPIFRLVQRTTVQGAQNIVFGLIAPAPDLQNGAVYTDGKVMEELMKHADELGSDAPQKLWELSEKIAKEILQ